MAIIKKVALRGFTLVEILIAITIMVLLLTAVTGNYIQFFFTSAVDGEIDSLVSLLRLAKSKAMSEADDKRHQVVITAGAFRLETDAGVTLENHVMNTQTEVDGGAGTITFEKITGITNSCPCTITIKAVSRDLVQRSVMVSREGLITVQ